MDGLEWEIYKKRMEVLEKLASDGDLEVKRWLERRASGRVPEPRRDMVARGVPSMSAGNRSYAPQGDEDQGKTREETDTKKVQARKAEDEESKGGPTTTRRRRMRRQKTEKKWRTRRKEEEQE